MAAAPRTLGMAKIQKLDAPGAGEGVPDARELGIERVLELTVGVHAEVKDWWLLTVMPMIHRICDQCAVVKTRHRRARRRWRRPGGSYE